MRPILTLVALLLPVAAVACGNSSTTSTGAGGTGGTASSTASTTASTTTGTGGTTASSTSSSSSSSSTSSTSTGTGGAPSCSDMCISNNPAAAQKFQGYTLKECGCAAGATCASACTAECATPPATLTDSSPCGMCLSAEEAKGQSSSCISAAGLNDCSADTTCLPFLECELGC